MKYNVGDILFVKKCKYKSRHLPRLLPHPRLRLYPYSELLNTVGIITKVHKHSDIFESGSTEDNNGYIWLSQVELKEYYFYEDEIECEVLK